MYISTYHTIYHYITYHDGKYCEQFDYPTRITIMDMDGNTILLGITLLYGSKMDYDCKYDCNYHIILKGTTHGRNEGQGTFGVEQAIIERTSKISGLYFYLNLLIFFLATKS